MLAKILLLIAVVTAISVRQAHSNENAAGFSASEAAAAYRYQETFGKRLPHPLKIEDCLLGKTEFVASYQRKEFFAPCRFINESVRHLKEILKLRAATYLFPLDVGYADLAVPKDLWEIKYSKLPSHEILSALLWDFSLAAVYPTAAPTKIFTNGKGVSGSKATNHKSVMGFYNGQPVTILTQSSESLRRSETDQYRTCATVYFLAHRFGEILFTVDGKPVMLDMSFDHDVDE